MNHRTDAVNVGNVPIAPGRARVTSSVALSPAELEHLDSIAAAGAVVEAKAVPREKAAGLAEIHRAIVPHVAATCAARISDFGSTVRRATGW